MRIAIVKLSALGDIVHSMIVLQFIKKHYPHAKIDWITEEAFLPILQNNHEIDDIKTLNLKSIKKQKKLIINELKKIKLYKKEKYDLVIDLQGLIKSAIVAKSIGKFCVGFDKNSARESLSSFFYSKSFQIPYEENVIIRNLSLVAKALKFDFQKEEILNKKPFLFYKLKDLKSIKKFISSQEKNILLVTGSSWHSKIYPKEKFVEIANSLDANITICWGNEEERKIAKFIAENSKAKKLPKLNLNQLKAIISQNDLIIGADTGPTHMAWALNRASITIFGPTPSQRNTFLTPINQIVDCQKSINPKKIDRNDFCIRNIDPKIIIKKAEKLLYG